MATWPCHAWLRVPVPRGTPRGGRACGQRRASPRSGAAHLPLVPQVPLAPPRRGGDDGHSARGVCHPAAVTGRFPASCSRGRGTGLAPLLGRCGAVLSSIPAAVPGMHFPGGFSQLGLAEGSLTSLLLAGCPWWGGCFGSEGCCAGLGVPAVARGTVLCGCVVCCSLGLPGIPVFWDPWLFRSNSVLLRLSITLVPRGDSGDRDVVLCLCPN